MLNAGALRAVLVIGLVLPAGVDADVNTEIAEALASAKDLYVATERKDGSRSAAAPVWFMYEGENVYFSTKADSHKARRLRNGGRVFVAVGSADGPAFEGWGTLESDPALIDRMARHYRQKYWIAWMGFFVPNAGRVAAGKTTIVKVTPGARAAR
jgi:general stress protein 26